MIRIIFPARNEGPKIYYVQIIHSRNRGRLQVQPYGKKQKVCKSHENRRFLVVVAHSGSYY